METRKLTGKEIEELYDFCWFNSVKFYEIQSELVDHIAQMIEQKWEQRPQLSFEKALDEVYVEFGKKEGLSAIADEREKAFKRLYKHLVIKTISEFYKLPKIIITLCLLVGIFVSLQNCPDPRWIVFPVAAIGIGTIIYFARYFRRNIYIRNKEFDFLFNQVSS